MRQGGAHAVLSYIAVTVRWSMTTHISSIQFSTLSSGTRWKCRTLRVTRIKPRDSTIEAMRRSGSASGVP